MADEESNILLAMADAAKKTLSFIVAGEAITGFEICLLYLMRHPEVGLGLVVIVVLTAAAMWY